MAKVVLCIQARMGSTRLPGKVLLPLLDKPVLQVEIERMRQCAKIDELVVITSTSIQDDQIVDLCKSLNCRFFRGSESDLLDRHYHASKELSADIVLKMPSDSPFMDPSLVDLGIDLLLQTDSEYVSNYHPPTFPDGLDVEVFRFQFLKRHGETPFRIFRESIQLLLYGISQRSSESKTSPTLSGICL